jgi:hypothetical protein
VPTVVVGECYERRVGGGTGSTESSQHQKTAVGVGLNLSEWYRGSHEKTVVEKGGPVRPGDRARAGCDHEGTAVGDRGVSRRPGVADAVECVERCFRVGKLDRPDNIGDRGSDLAHEDAVFPAINPEAAGLSPHLATGILIAVRWNDHRARDFGSDVKILRGTAPIVAILATPIEGKILKVQAMFQVLIYDNGE